MIWSFSQSWLKLLQFKDKRLIRWTAYSFMQIRYISEPIWPFQISNLIRGRHWFCIGIFVLIYKKDFSDLFVYVFGWSSLLTPLSFYLRKCYQLLRNEQSFLQTACIQKNGIFYQLVNDRMSHAITVIWKC